MELETKTGLFFEARREEKARVYSTCQKEIRIFILASARPAGYIQFFGTTEK